MPPLPLPPHGPLAQETGPTASRRAESRRRIRSLQRPEVVLRVCPDCAGPLAHTSGCVTCLACGWGRCG